MLSYFKWCHLSASNEAPLTSKTILMTPEQMFCIVPPQIYRGGISPFLRQISFSFVNPIVYLQHGYQQANLLLNGDWFRGGDCTRWSGKGTVSQLQARFC